jgi:hypothetical protein
MTIGGWIILTLSVGSVVALFTWCLIKVLRTPNEEEHLHGVPFHTPDEDRRD